MHSLVEEPTVSQEDKRDSINLDQLDLSDIHLEAEKPKPHQSRPSSSSSLGRWVLLTLLIIAIGLILWIPQTHFFQTAGGSGTLSFAISGVALVIAFLGGRWVWGWLEESAASWEAKPRDERPEREVSRAERWLTLLGALALGGVVVGLPDSVSLGVGSGTIKGLCGVAAAGLGGRWLFVQAARKVDPETFTPFEARELPRWMKWVSLALLLIGAFIAGFGEQIFGVGSHNTVLAAVGLGVGLFGAIWLSRRFDEIEQEFKASTRKGPPPTKEG